MSVIYNTQAELDADLAMLQKLLRIQDWKITARLVDSWDMGEAWARITPVWDRKEALLDIQDAKGHASNALGAKCMRLCLIHELLHLLTLPIRRHYGEKKAEGQCEPEELAINLIAGALEALLVAK